MAQAVVRPVPWGPVLAASAATAVAAGILVWQWDLRQLEARITQKRAALKKLSVSGGIPPNQQVADYLAGRQAAVEQRYAQWQQLLAAPPLPEAAKADPQLHFQEQYHQVQRALEQLAAARKLSPPELLGFPKELPPSDTVPRLLVQLGLIQELAELTFGQEVVSLASFKVEDPDTVAEEQTSQPFLVRLPVRVRFTATLPQAMKALAAIHRSAPLIDVRLLRMTPSTAADPAAAEWLDVDLVAARYLILAPTEGADDDAAAAAKPKSGKKPARATSGARHKPEAP